MWRFMDNVRKRYFSDLWLSSNNSFGTHFNKKIIRGEKGMKIIRIDKELFEKMVDDMVLEAENDKEFKEALKWLDRTSAIDGNFYDKVFQLMFINHIPTKKSRNKSRKRMDKFMRDNVWRKSK